MARKRRHNNLQAGELNLTAMIDVAFQLLSFFIVTSHPMDVIAHLTAPAASPSPGKTPINQSGVVRIKILSDGSLTVNGGTIDQGGLDRVLGGMARFDKGITVLILCTAQSPHSKLVEVLDVCAKEGLSNLALLSAD